MSVDIDELRQQIADYEKKVDQTTREVEQYKQELEEQREEDRLARAVPELDAGAIRKRLSDAITKLEADHKEANYIHPVLRAPKYSADERRQLQHAADRAFLETWRTADQELVRAEKAEVDRVGHAAETLKDPMRQLSTSGVARASGLLVFVGQSIDGGTPAAIRSQLDSVLASGDRELAAVWAHVLGLKDAAYIEQLRVAGPHDKQEAYMPVSDLRRAAASDKNKRTLTLAEKRLERASKARTELGKLVDPHLIALNQRGLVATGQYGPL